MIEKFNWRFAALIGCAGILTNTFWVAFNAYVPIFLQSGHPLAETTTVAGFALSPFIANFIMTWDNIVHMFLNPWVGALSDRTWGRFGRRKPWLLLGFPIALVGFILIPYATSIAAIMLFIMLTNFGTGLYRAPLRAWTGDFFAPADRARGDSLVHVMAGLAVVAVSIVGGRLFDNIGRTAPFWLTVGLMLAVFALVVLRVQEDEGTATTKQDAPTSFLTFLRTLRQPHNRRVLWAASGVMCVVSAHAAFQANLTPFSVFELNVTTGRAGQLLGIAALIYIATALPSGLLATRFGARRVMLTGATLYGVSALLIMQFATDERSFLLPFLLTGFAWALVSVNALPLILNFDTSGRSGLFTGLFFFAFQLGNILGPLLAGAAISLFDSQRMMLAFVVVGMSLAFFAFYRVET